VVTPDFVAVWTKVHLAVPAQADIQAVLLDSSEKRAGMTRVDFHGWL
jgi:hypothetical protein